MIIANKFIKRKRGRPKPIQSDASMLQCDAIVMREWKRERSNVYPFKIAHSISILIDWLNHNFGMLLIWCIIAEILYSVDIIYDNFWETRLIASEQCNMFIECISFVMHSRKSLILFIEFERWTIYYRT